jgi:hypothetical protein
MADILVAVIRQFHKSVCLFTSRNLSNRSFALTGFELATHATGGGTKLSSVRFFQGQQRRKFPCPVVTNQNIPTSRSAHVSALLMSAETNSSLAIAAVASRLLTTDVLALVGKR